MTPSVDLTAFITMALPAFSALICLTIYFSPKKNIPVQKDKEICISLSGYFITVAFNWFTMALFYYFPETVIRLYPLRYASLLLTQVFFFRLIYTLTQLPGDKPFSLWHFALPLLMAGIGVLWSAITPDWVVRQLTQTFAEPVDSYIVFSIFNISYFILRFMYDIIYILLSIRRIKRYRREIENYASQLQQSYMAWLNIFIILSIVLIIGPALASYSFSFSPVRTATVNRWIFIPIIILMAQHILIVYNTLIRNFIILEDAPEEISSSFEIPEKEEKLVNTIGKREFEKFFSETRPFTDKDLKITDLAYKLNTNRTYLSAFINTTYGINFSTLINERRLKYLEELRINPAMKDKTNLELIHLAGFGSYQSYLRAKEKQAKISTLKI